MEIHDTPRMADAFGVPTYYVTDTVMEDAGGGNIRIMNCQLRNGILVPQCEVIIPASRLLQSTMEASAFARELCHREQNTVLLTSGTH